VLTSLPGLVGSVPGSLQRPRQQHIFPSKVAIIAHEREPKRIFIARKLVNTVTLTVPRADPAGPPKRQCATRHPVLSPAITLSVVIEIDIERPVCLYRPNCP